MVHRRKALSTGVGALDRKLGGGIPAGSVVAVRAKPASQSEQLLYALAAQRETVYLTTQRTVSSVRQAIEATDAALTGVHVYAVDAAAPIADVREYLRRFEKPVTVVIDTMGPLEAADSASFRDLLRALDRRATETDSLVVLHCLDRQPSPANRELTCYVADLVVDLDTSVDRERVYSRLLVPKFRGGPAITAALRLDLRDCVVDTSRNGA